LTARRVAALVAVALLLAAACSRKVDEPRAEEAPVGNFGVGVVTAQIDAGSAGTLPTELFYPAQVAAGQDARRAAATAASEGPFPLVVFVHGAGTTPNTYRALIQAIAARGYVVAAPAFPESSSPDIVGSDRAFELAEPQALALPAVIDRVRVAGIGGVPTASLIAPDQLHLVGHSLGAATVLAAGYNSCCRIDGLASVSAISATLLDTSGDYDLSGTPLLLVHGRDDDVLPVGQAEAIHADAAPPNFLVELAGSSHFDLVQPNSSGYVPLLLAVTSMLAGDGGQRTVDGLESVADSNEAVTLQSDP